MTTIYLASFQIHLPARLTGSCLGSVITQPRIIMIDRSVDGAGIRVEKQFVGVEKMARLWIIVTIDAIAI
jgi:hypothetical protein